MFTQGRNGVKRGKSLYRSDGVLNQRIETSVKLLPRNNPMSDIPTETLRIALVSFRAEFGDVSKNLENIDKIDDFYQI